jgi:hypothetical protein
MKMKYEAIKQLSQGEIEAAILRNDPEKLPLAVLSAALHSDDSDWAEDVCWRLSKHEHSNIRGSAIQGFGHIARIHGKLNQKQIKPVIEAALNDENDLVRGQADDTADDVEFFLKWRIHRP